MRLAGGVSVFIGAALIISAFGGNPKLSMLAVYATTGGIDFVIQAWLLARRRHRLATPGRPGSAGSLSGLISGRMPKPEHRGAPARVIAPAHRVGAPAARLGVRVVIGERRRDGHIGGVTSHRAAHYRRVSSEGERGVSLEVPPHRVMCGASGLLRRQVDRDAHVAGAFDGWKHDRGGRSAQSIQVVARSHPAARADLRSARGRRWRMGYWRAMATAVSEGIPARLGPRARPASLSPTTPGTRIVRRRGLQLC